MTTGWLQDDSRMTQYDLRRLGRDHYCHWSSIISHWSSVVSHWSSVVSHWFGHHLSVICHQLSVISCQSSVISHQSSVIGHQSSVIGQQSSVISHQSSVIGHHSSVSRKLSVISHQSSVSLSLNDVECCWMIKQEPHDRSVLLFDMPFWIVCDQQHWQLVEYLGSVPVWKDPRQAVGDAQQGDRPPRLRHLLLQPRYDLGPLQGGWVHLELQLLFLQQEAEAHGVLHLPRPQPLLPGLLHPLSSRWGLGVSLTHWHRCSDALTLMTLKITKCLGYEQKSEKIIF